MQDGSVHDYMFDQESCDWLHWMKTVPAQELPPTLAFHEIIVQTIDTVRYSYLMRLLITHSHHTLFTGLLHMHSVPIATTACTPITIAAAVSQSVNQSVRDLQSLGAS